MNKKKFKECENKLNEVIFVYKLFDLRSGYIERDIERQEKHIAKGTLSKDEELIFYDFYYEFRDGLVLEREYIAREILLKLIYDKYDIMPEIHYFGVHIEPNYNCVDIARSIIKVVEKLFSTLKKIMPDTIWDKEYATYQVTKMFKENLGKSEWYLGVTIKNFIDSKIKKELGIEQPYTIGDKVIHNISDQKYLREVMP